MKVRFTIRDSMKLVMAGALGLWLIAVVTSINWSPRTVHYRYCHQNLKQIGQAMLQNHATYGCFPPAYLTDKDGKPMHSWRTLLLPDLDAKDIYEVYDFTKPWDSSSTDSSGTFSNQALCDTYIKLFTCPQNGTTIQGRGQTNYVVIVGPNTPFPGSGSTSLRDSRDKPSETILIVEVPHSDILWGEPRDLDAKTMSLFINDPNKTGIGGEHSEGAYAFFADGSVKMLPNSLLPTTIKAMTTIRGGETINPRELKP